MVAVAEKCRSILEIDLAGCQSISSASVTALLSNLGHLRELRLAQCTGIDSHAFTNLKSGLRFDALRILDLTACDGVGDDAIARIIPAAPRLRNLVLAKCRNITDQAVRAICTLTKNLHYIHLGHCQLLTDDAVIELVQQCNRIRYIDLACCSRLTDASVRHLAKLPKLRRVGLVKCQNLTDASIIALARGPYGSGAGKPGMPTQFVSLERVHLSYCTSLTLKGITQLLLNCPRLTHLSLTGVQAFLRDDLTRFCREAPSEFTHVQRDVFCVFSGEGVERLRDYLTRLALEQQERDQEQQTAIDEQVVGPDSPDADSLSDGTIDGTDPRQLDMIFGLGRHGMPRVSNTRDRRRPRSFHDLPHPNFHIDMPLLPHDQMQRIGPWTPGTSQLTPDLRTQMTPQIYSIVNPSFSPYPGQDYNSMRVPSPIQQPSLHVPETPGSRSRSQSRRHTMDVADGFFGSQPTRPGLATGAASRYQEGIAFGPVAPEHVPPPPTFQTTLHGGSPSYSRSQYISGESSLRPDPHVSSFEVNHDAILSTIPNSRGPSRGPSRSSSPHLSRVHSRSRIIDVLNNVRGVPQTPSGILNNDRSSPDARPRSAFTSDTSHAANPQLDPSNHNSQGQSRFLGASNTTQQYRPLPQLLPSDLIDQIMLSPATPLSAAEDTPPPTRGRYGARRDPEEDVNMTE